MRPVLLVPGIQNSGPAHWQSRWEALQPGVTRVMQRDWDQPVCSEWVQALDTAVHAAAEAPIVVAHSLGCLVVAHWAAQSRRALHAALLVAVPDPNGPAFPREATGFAPLPSSLPGRRLCCVSSQDDPYSTEAFAKETARQWRAEHIEMGPRGHLNAQSGLGDWAEGWARVVRWRAEG
ncbi:alpha/beta hydrolase [Piscinibacter sp. HJYY11]|uniref:RBBP9/YdeN family alpha/beta hydrolase n=1 Tax=Piscinibacter sp. HJYY11 TaxID=2801333 RepID=UPI00191EF24E|nr:alpha/beta hydrolase [Piscinibacter sp. HJYY11]MBL0729543.1 serine hydrolase family protein [Piscinibacter sp. HJYY11]